MTIAVDSCKQVFYNRIKSQQQEDLSVKLKVVLEPSEEGGFTVYVPSLPGCISEGDTEEEALKNIREAVELYLEPVEDELVNDSNVKVMELTL